MAFAAPPPPLRRVVVLGGTGRQGGATARRLQALGGYAVVVLSRQDPAVSEDIARLRAEGLETVRGDSNDKASLVAAFTGAYGVFGVTNPFAKRWTGTQASVTDTDSELAQGRNIADAALECGVRILVFSSVANANDGTGIPTYDAKSLAEAHIRRIGVPCAILAPTGFFENLLSPFAGMKQGSLPGLVRAGKKAQMVACRDIGVFAGRCFEDPDAHIGKRIELAGDELTMQEMEETIAEVRGEQGQWKVNVPPAWVFALFIPKAIAKLKVFLDEKGSHVDIASLRKVHPALQSFRDWLLSEGLDKKVLPSPGWCVVA